VSDAVATCLTIPGAGRRAGAEAHRGGCGQVKEQSRVKSRDCGPGILIHSW
jgi:hypothetical protein